MPASVVPISGRKGTYVVLEAVLPGRPPEKIGVLLIDSAGERLWVRMRRRYDDLADPGDAEVLAALEDDIREHAADEGAEAFLSSLEDSLSNVLRIGERRQVAVDSFTRVLEGLYAAEVEAAEVKPYVTHLPLYSLRAAAGKLGEDMEAEEEDWVALPEAARGDANLFVAHVVGRSMEPRIPDGSLNLFRFRPVGSRQGKILLVQRFGVLDETARYTVKRYTSKKVETAEDEWRHERIRLEPLNPEFEAWDVEPNDFAVVAEWIRVIE